MVEIKIKNKCFQMKLISWDGGAALLPKDEPAAETSPLQRKIIGTVGGKVLRLFPAAKTAHELAPRWRA